MRSLENCSWFRYVLGAVAAGMLVSAVAWGAVTAQQDPAKPQPGAQAPPPAAQETAPKKPTRPSIKGTYRLVSRDLPDGTTVRPPVVEGLLSFSNKYRNFNVTWTDSGGKRTSIAAISEYKLTNKEYSETNIYYLVSDEIGDKALEYDVKSATAKSPLTKGEGTLAFQLPLHGEPAVVFTERGLTATRQGEFVDHWEKVK